MSRGRFVCLGVCGLGIYTHHTAVTTAYATSKSYNNANNANDAQCNYMQDSL
jgi:hypothetical protein